VRLADFRLDRIIHELDPYGGQGHNEPKLPQRHKMRPKYGNTHRSVKEKDWNAGRWCSDLASEG
jgi:hypothetical protein